MAVVGRGSHDSVMYYIIYGSVRAIPTYRVYQLYDTPLLVSHVFEACSGSPQTNVKCTKIMTYLFLDYLSDHQLWKTDHFVGVTFQSPHVKCLWYLVPLESWVWSLQVSQHYRWPAEHSVLGALAWSEYDQRQLYNACRWPVNTQKYNDNDNAQLNREKQYWLVYLSSLIQWEAEKWWRFHFVLFHLNGFMPFPFTILFPFCMHVCAINCLGCLLTCKKLKASSFAHRVELVVIHSLPKSFWDSLLLLLFGFKCVLWS